MELDFEDENEDLREVDNKSPFDYRTEQPFCRVQKNFNEKIEDGLPTIFEKSTIEMIEPY